MTYIRTDAAEIDAWALLGASNWTWDALYPYYLDVEAFTPPLTWQAAAGATYDPPVHGKNGEVKTGFLTALPNGSLHSVVEQTWSNLGLAQIRDVNGGSTRGFDVWPMTVDPDQNLRWDAARAFYWPVSGRQNLKLVKGTARRVIWAPDSGEDGVWTANGVEFESEDGSLEVLNATKEVVLSAGAWRTPPILELSGVGNPRYMFLREKSVAFASDL
jgi:choline dehydrogenase